MRVSQGSLPTTVVSDGLECLEMYQGAMSYTWSSFFCQVVVERGMLGMSKKYIRLQEKKS